MSTPAPDLRFGAGSLAELGDVLDGLGVRRALLVTTARGAEQAAGAPVAAVYTGVRRHSPGTSSPRSSIAPPGRRRTASWRSAAAAPWTRRRRCPSRPACRSSPCRRRTRARSGRPPSACSTRAPRTKRGGDGAVLRGVVYDPELTLTLPRDETAGTALNALAHCAEALYVKGTNQAAQRNAFTGARAIAYALPLVLERPEGIYGRSRLLEGALRAGRALAASGLAVGHALAQAVGARYDLPHGALNAICLPPALRFNAPVAPVALETLGEAMSTDDPIGRVEELAALGGFGRLRDLGVPEEELPEVAELASRRAGARANPRPVTAQDAEKLLRSVW